MPARSGGRSTVPRSPRVRVMRWREFQRFFRRAHKPGEHVAVVGPNGTGKTMVALELAKLIGSKPGRGGRPYRMTVLVSKRRDRTLSKFQKRHGWPNLAGSKWPPPHGQEHCFVWPRGVPVSERGPRLGGVFGPLLDAIEAEGHQGVLIDEEADFERPIPKGLGLATTMEGYWTMARSSELTLIAATQRPRHVTLSMWSESAWLVIFPAEEEKDLERVVEVAGRRVRDRVYGIVDRLGGHEFLVVQRQRSGARGLYVSKVGT